MDVCVGVGVGIASRRCGVTQIGRDCVGGRVGVVVKFGRSEDNTIFRSLSNVGS